jgi:CRP-like cAMP-binding protein/CheY-like chemotaxis protein
MKKILLIEDNLDIRENTAEILELANYDVITAENGKRGVEAAKKELPDLILCDIMMPEMDGYGVIHILSKTPKTAHIPFIFLTAKADKVDIRKGMALGADDYITKPFDETDLLNAIEVRLNKTNAIQDAFKKFEESPKEQAQKILSLNELSELFKANEKKVYRKGQVLYTEGDTANTFFFIVSGKVKGIKTDSYGKVLVTNILKEGEFFGHIEILEDTKRKETVETIEETELIATDKAEFLKLLESNRNLATLFLKKLALDVHENEERLLKLAYASVRERTAETLLKLTEKTGSTTISITREDLSNIVGTATESLIRTLSEFKEEGIISSKGREICVNDLSLLKREINPLG